MIILTTFFEYPEYPHEYSALNKVFEMSCKKHMPDVEIVTLKLDVDVSKNTRHIGYHANTIKLRAVSEYIKSVDDDVILIDSDMLCLRPGYHAFDKPFDIAYTMRTKLNGLGSPTINDVVSTSNSRKYNRGRILR